MAYDKKIGLIGLGLVGEALAHRLIEAGYEVVGYDVDAARARRLDSSRGHSLGSIEALDSGGSVVPMNFISSGGVESAPVIVSFFSTRALC